MDCEKTYSREYIDKCRARIAAQVSAYQTLVSASRIHAENEAHPLYSAIHNFEPHFFNNLVLALENSFVHRSRTLELKNGNPLNEVRMLSNSIVNNHGRLGAYKTIKYNPDRAVLKLKIGDEIKVTETGFLQLADAFFGEIEKKYHK
jgi:hypothetical protein